MKRWHGWATRLVSWVHPDIEGLLQLAEGKSSLRAEAHLAWCGDCRERAALLRDSSQPSPMDKATTALLDDLFENLQLRMRSVRDGRYNVTAAVEHYFGKRAVLRLEGSSHRDAGEVRRISTAKALFNAFLGRKAADALTSRLASVA